MMTGWNSENAAHLLRRAGFGPTQKEVEKAIGWGFEKTLAKLFKPDTKSDANFTVPPDIPIDDVPVAKLQAWWLRRMVKTKSPLTEKVALFWHNHFATAHHKVEHVVYLHQQNQTFRKHGLGSFRKLLTSVSKTPAMIAWLDNYFNVKGQPNENFAREVMELFTTGVLDQEGNANYTENDVKEAARAFTGWQFANDKFFFNSAVHDFDVKTFKGVTGDLDGDDILNQLVMDYSTARRVVAKLFSFFAYEVKLDDSVLDSLVVTYYANDTEIAPILEAIFRSDAFFSDQAKFDRVKSPAEFVVGTLRMLGGKLAKKEELDAEIGAMTSELGQSLFDPPSVFGWKEGTSWVTSNRMLKRTHVASRIALSRPGEGTAYGWKVSKLLGSKSKWDSLTPDKVVARCLERLGGVPAEPSTVAVLRAYLQVNDGSQFVDFELDEEVADNKIRGLVSLILSSPEFQLA